MTARRLWALAAGVLLTCSILVGCDQTPERRDATGAGSDGRAAPGQASSSATPVATSETSPGRGLLIVRQEGLLLRDMAGDNESVIKRSPAGVFFAYPRWSPDGTRIAFVVFTLPTGGSTQDWGANVVLSRPDGSDERTIFTRPSAGSSVEGIAWTPDGKSLYFGLNQPVVRDGRIQGAQLSIEQVELVTGSRTTLVRDAAYPAVAPDGSRVAFLTYSYGNDSQPAGLWSIGTDGTNRQLLLRAANAGDRFAGLRWPRFSPDGTRIAFGAVLAEDAMLPTPSCQSGFRWPWQPRTAEAHGPPIDIWAIPAAGGEPEKLSDLDEDDPHIAWSPDGTQLAALGGCGLYRITLGGGPSVKNGPGEERSQIDWR